MKPKYRRKAIGSVIFVLPLVLLLISLAVAALAFDYGHGLSVRCQLQNATDAASLAGAYDLLKTSVTPADATKAEKTAYDVAATNVADNVAVANNPNTVVSVQVNSATMPRTVTVTATRTNENVFAKLIGFNTIPVSATSTAQAYKGITEVQENQLMSIAVSLNYVPTSGPQNGQSLNSYIGSNRSKPFTIVLNPQSAKNAAWLKNWSPHQNPVLRYGQDTLMLNGTKAELVQDLYVGETIYVPLMLDGPPYNQSRPIIGVMGFIITKINYPNSVEGYIAEPTILKGTPGVPVYDSIDQQSQQFVEENQSWVVNLIN